MTQDEISSQLRRVITGIAPSGKSIVVIDGKPAETFASGLVGLYEIWSDAGEPIERGDTRDRAAGDVVLEPPSGGVRVRWFSISSFAPGLSADEQQAELDEAFSAMGGDSSRVDTARHPGMHLTKTIDVVAIFSGRVRLILEESEVELGPGDVVVQRGTNHAWEAIGDEPAICLGVLIDRDFAV